MNEFEQLLSIIACIKKSSDYSLFNDIPQEYLKPKIELNKLTALMNEKINKKRQNICLFPNCQDKPILSHSLQKSLLKSIVDKTNHVKRITINVEFKVNGKFTVLDEKIGINKASTFEGFCNKHDTEIFKPIENGNIDYTNKEHLFLLLYRSISREYFEVNKSYFLMSDVINDLIKDMDKDNMLGACFWAQLYLQCCELFHMENVKKCADLCLIGKIWDNNYDYFHLKLDKYLPIFLNAFFAVQGTNCDILYIKDITKESPLFCSVTIIPQNNETDIFYAVPKEQSVELKPFLRQLQNSNVLEKEYFLTDLILRNSDNFYISSEFWERIPEDVRRKIIYIFKKTINDREYVYNDKINFFEYV